MRYDTIIKTDGDCALYVPCSLVQLERVVVCVRVLVDVLCVMIVVLIGHYAVGAVLVAIFVVIFCNWRCTLYTSRTHVDTHPHRSTDIETKRRDTRERQERRDKGSEQKKVINGRSPTRDERCVRKEMRQIGRDVGKLIRQKHERLVAKSDRLSQIIKNTTEVGRFGLHVMRLCYEMCHVL